MAGLILVFDMDQTIIGNHVTSEKLDFNPKVLAILRRAMELRPGKVKAIFLLTNNGFDSDINLFHIKLLHEIFPQNRNRPSSVFDGIMTANTLGRLKEYLPKRLEDVEFLMKERFGPDVKLKDLADRVYFFDDLVPEHLIKNELPEGHYIRIDPPFELGVKDRTNYKPIYDALGMQDTARGGAKKKAGRITRKLRRSVKYTRALKRG